MHPEFLLIFSGGLLGSAHCVGMCGPFALSIGASSSNWRANFARQATFSLGRIATYTSMGAIAGYVGSNLTSSFARILPVQSILAIVAGAVLVVQGLQATGVMGRMIIPGQHPCLTPQILRTFLTTPGLSGAFLAGVFTGFLPCGLVYAFLALASATSSMFGGWLVMLAFGLGTMPIMIATGLGSGLLSLAIRARILDVCRLVRARGGRCFRRPRRWIPRIGVDRPEPKFKLGSVGRGRK